MVKWSFSNETARELLVLYQREEKLMRILCNERCSKNSKL